MALCLWLGPSSLKANAATSVVVVAWGSNGSGQTTIPAGLSGSTAIAAAGNYAVALKGDGTVVAWGDNGFGQTNVPASLSGVTAVAAGYYHCVALKSDGTVVAWGNNTEGQTNIPGGLSGVMAIAAGGSYTVALVGTGPRITVQSTGNDLTLLWPVSPVAYQVQSTSILLPPVAWSNVNGNFQTNAGTISFVLPMVGGQKFYRLVTP